MAILTSTGYSIFNNLTELGERVFSSNLTETGEYAPYSTSTQLLPDMVATSNSNAVCTISSSDLDISLIATSESSASMYLADIVLVATSTSSATCALESSIPEVNLIATSASSGVITPVSSSVLNIIGTSSSDALGTINSLSDMLLIATSVSNATLEWTLGDCSLELNGESASNFIVDILEFLKMKATSSSNATMTMVSSDTDLSLSATSESSNKCLLFYDGFRKSYVQIDTFPYAHVQIMF